MAQGYSYAAEAENAAWSSNNGTALDAFTRWKASAGHDANMLGAYTDVGLALAGSKFGYFWTAVFARPADW
ncbi:MAG: CAP domain-containing protein [Chloroflexota bacterium]